MTNGAYTARWLTSRRLRAHAIIVGVALWSIYIWTLATPGLRDRNGNLKGTDFLHFYTLGLVAIEHRGLELYDMKAQSALATEHIPESASINYLPLYPPQVSILFAPFAHVSYSVALAIWWFTSSLIYFLCCYLTWRACPSLQDHSVTVAIAAAAFPAFFHLIAWGQTSALALGCFSFMFYCLLGKRQFLAGIGLGCLAFKPQLALAAGVVFVFVGAWKVVVGAACSAGAQFSVGILYYGTQSFRDWLWMIKNLPSALPYLEPKIYQTHCLRTFWSMLIPWPNGALALYLISGGVVLALTITLWRRPATVPLTVRFPALLFATVLAAPHLTVYDLVILAPAILLLSDWLLSSTPTRLKPHIATALYLVYMLPLAGPLARWTHVQLSVIAMSAILLLIWCQLKSTHASRT